jgi:hypothetical protein
MVSAAGTEAPKLGMLKGFYNKHSSTQGVSVEKCRSLLAQAAELVPVTSRTSLLQIGEWGCASGGNSIAPILAIGEILNERASSKGENNKLQLHVTHTDVTGNSWTELFLCAKKYQQQVHNDFPRLSVTYAGIGSSQYERNHPDGTLDLGFSFNALHCKWLLQPTWLYCGMLTCCRPLPLTEACFQHHSLCRNKNDCSSSGWQYSV